MKPGKVESIHFDCLKTQVTKSYFKLYPSCDIMMEWSGKSIYLELRWKCASSMVVLYPPMTSSLEIHTILSFKDPCVPTFEMR